MRYVEINLHTRKNNANKKIFSDFAFTVVGIIALLYGVSPQWFMQTFLDVSDYSLDIAHILRAVMGL